ncbi:ribonuclease R [Paenibacillus albiflavus]|uniref:Ribonuclease R n=1 Tax=Paenibacillus albiflavus TaxID=2545760 RepID=A0A4R4EDC5_9BACL|nr:ribonuclease R [Paenibacillus albiflavus]TCZ75975.1 ribonuclease R [Paenibacillus albiflavus]
MITEQDILTFMRETAYRPMTYGELEKHFGIQRAEDFKQFLKVLNELENKGFILRSNNDRYGVPERMNMLRGRLQAHAKGFGFLIPDDRDQQDIYINAADMHTAMNGDTILVRITSQSPSGGRTEGEVVQVISRANTQIIGTFQSNGTFGFVIPDDKRVNRDIFIPEGSFQGAVNGQKVVAKIVSYPEGRAAAEGQIVEILGHKDDPGVDILSIIRKYNLPEAFSEEVMAEAAKAPESISDEELLGQGRRDLRDKQIVTIDGEDAKDLDDAVNVERLPNGNYLLGVHIADVGYYVKEGSMLDREAYARGCSVYLVDRVIPMLPHRLSNGICSLNPQVNRLTMSCEMEFDSEANVVRHDIFTSVIKTTERMTYTNVRKILTEPDEHPELMERYAGLVDHFKLMDELAMKLRSKRQRRGAIDFDFQESKVIVDENGKPTDIIKRERSIAEMIIEEFMLAANETVAEHFYWLKVPFLYRIHEDPDQEKLIHFLQFVANFGYVVKGAGNKKVHPRALQDVLEEIKGTKEETVISTVMLRSMKQARYEAQSLGHFGLAAEFYSHFTSPIRRYPDLVIHRMIREVIENGVLSEQRNEYMTERMKDIAQQSSDRERVAVDAERDTEALKKAEFMLDKVGEEFEGIISSVTGFGMFIELDNSVEGLIRLSDLTDDYYNYHEMYHMLIGERTSKTFRIGDEVKIRVARVNMDDHTIDFEMVDMKPRNGGKQSLFDKFGGRTRGGSGVPGGGRGRRGGKRDDQGNAGGFGQKGKKDRKSQFSGESAKSRKKDKDGKIGIQVGQSMSDPSIDPPFKDHESTNGGSDYFSNAHDASGKGRPGKRGGKSRNGKGSSQGGISLGANGQQSSGGDRSSGRGKRKNDTNSSVQTGSKRGKGDDSKNSYSGDWASSVNVLRNKGKRPR